MAPSPIPIDIDRPRSYGLIEHSDLFRVLIEGIRDYAIFVLDPEGHVLTWNPGAQAMKGYAKEEIIGKHFSQFISPKPYRVAGQNEN